MSIAVLMISDTDKEVYQADTIVTVSVPGLINEDIFRDKVGVKIETMDNGFSFLLTPKGMDKVLSFYGSNKNNINADTPVFLSLEEEDLGGIDESVEVSIPATYETKRWGPELFEGAIGFTVRGIVDNRLLTLTPKGLEEIDSFYRKNKNRLFQNK